LRARLNRGVARSGEPVDFTGLYMQRHQVQVRETVMLN